MAGKIGGTVSDRATAIRGAVTAWLASPRRIVLAAGGAGVFAAVTGAVLAAAVAFALVFEAWALSTGNTTITGYVRAGVGRWPYLVIPSLVGLGVLLAHFLRFSC